MDPREVDALVQRLVANPHDQEALAYAHQAGASDPRSYATLLERVGRETRDPAYASHWLSEAANVWSTTLGDAHHAAEVLLLAVVKDPTQDLAADRLAQLYRDKGDVKGLVALLEKRAKLLAPVAAQDDAMKPKLAAMHEELGTLWAEAPLSQPVRALDNFKRAYETDAQSVFAIYSARELLKQQQQYAEAIPLFDMEQALVTDHDRKMALYRDQADVCRLAGDFVGLTNTLRNLRAYAPDDPGLMQEQATAVLERIRTGEQVGDEEVTEGGQLFVTLAETYDGEHGYSYSIAGLEIDPTNDRAIQLATYYGEQLGRTAELPPWWKKYMSSNPNGAMAEEVRTKLQASGEQVPAPGTIPLRDVVSEAPEAEPAAASTPAEPAPVEEPAAASAPAAAEPEPPKGSLEPEPEPEPVYSSSPAEALSPERMSALLDEASALASKRKTREALAKYMEVLHHDPVSPEALAWVDEHLRAKRKFADLRDVYQAASRVSGLPSEDRRKYLSKVANICEQQLRDVDGAIQALKRAAQIDPSARDNLRRLLEKGHRWDDLAVLLDQEVDDAPDSEAQIALLKKLASMHEQKRKDPVSAGEAWGRLAAIMVGDESPILHAVKLFEKGERLDLAAEVIADSVSGIDAEDTRQMLLMKLGELREKTEDLSGAGDAYAEAARIGAGDKGWEAAERCFATAERWDDAALAVSERADIVDEPRKKAELYAKEAGYLFQAGQGSDGIGRLEHAAELDPENETYAKSLEERYIEADRVEDLIDCLVRRAANLTNKDARIALRKRAAQMQREQLSDMEGARETLQLVLEDTEDIEALTLLAEDARERAEFQEEAALLHRLAAVTEDDATKLEIVLREANVLAVDLENLEGAVTAYEMVLEKLDHKNVAALKALADLEERRDNPKNAVSAIEKLLELAAEPDQKVELGRRLADLYENTLDDPRGAIRALEVVYAEDPDDLDAAARLVELCEGVESWERTAELLAVLIEIEGDPEEASDLARRLSSILDERLERGQEALAVLEPLADEGDGACRDAYVELGDRLGFKGIVAMKLRDWHALSAGEEQHEAFRGAFERFREMGRDQDAAQIAVELIRSRGATDEIIEHLEEISVRTKDLDSLGAAHDVRVRDLSGTDRAEEYVRQAEVLAQAGVAVEDAAQHGEQGLPSIAPEEVEPLLQRLAELVGAPGFIIDLYERQVGRCKNPADKLQALARAAQVAAAQGALDRAQALFELALGGGVREETIEVLQEAARAGDIETGSKQLRTALATSLASGSHGARDGGRTRSALLRRAAMIAFEDLEDTDKAFEWLGESLVTHVEGESLDALQDLGERVEDLKRVEETIGKALEQVFDGPLVRQLVSRRAELRRNRLDDMPGAAEDLKRLHDLSPHDKEISDELHDLLVELRDWRGVVQLLEDQILRGKDPAVRAELARKAARLWEERLADPREAADAWRRVLRMKPQDSEAKEGLDRAKSNMLKKPMSQLPPDPGELPEEPNLAPPAVPTDVAEELAGDTTPPEAPEPALAQPEPEPLPAALAPAPVFEADAQPSGDATVEQVLPSAEGYGQDTAQPESPSHEQQAQPVDPGVGPNGRPLRPDVDFQPQTDELTLSTPTNQSAGNATDEYPAADMAFNGAADDVEYVPEDLIESLDDAEDVSDDELIMEPAAPVEGQEQKQ